MPFEKWCKGHIVLPLSVRPSPSASGVSNLRLSFFRREASVSFSFGDISSSSYFILFIVLLLCLSDLVKLCDHLVGEGELVTSLAHVYCLLCLIVPLAGYVL